jgi:hypothetical protein
VKTRLQTLWTATAVIAMACGTAADGRSLAIVACPIIQDTPSVPCWIVEHDGETYYLGIQSDVSAPFNPPSLGHKVLVEGEVKATGERICGGRVIEPVTVSVMPELSPECSELRVVRPGVELPFEPPRPPGPSMGRLAFSPPPPAPLPQPPFSAKAFVVPYEFEGMVNFKTPQALVPVLEYARAIGATRIEIAGYRGATRLSDGRVLVEREGIASARAEEIAQMLRGAGLDRAEYAVSASESPAEGSPDLRRVVITVMP